MADKRRNQAHIVHLRAASIALAVGITLLMLLAARSLQAQTFNLLHTFDGTDGDWPIAGLIRATDGNLYGTTYHGGANQTCYGMGCGTVFKISLTGTMTTLYNFCSQEGCTDGFWPVAGLIQATDGNFYGTTDEGGANQYGTIFKITPSGSLTTLYSFNWTDGAYPQAALIQAADENFYGTTEYGGVYSDGSVFRITASGTLTTLYSFACWQQSGCPDGALPLAALIQANDGNFYGTTFEGGTNNFCSGEGCGTVFRITPSGTLTTLYSFCAQSNCADGANPYAALIQAADGNFYGTTSGIYASTAGTAFKITPTGTLATLYDFCSQSGCMDGSTPYYGALIQANDGNLYGTTVAGGYGNTGTVFKISSTGALTTLLSFIPGEATAPYDRLIQDTNGKFYGTTAGGGSANDGTVFGLSVGLGPFVETQPTLGKVGIPVKILGTNLTGATSVTFNGTPAVFTVVAPSLIRATVPEGATTGTVQVVTPGGTLTSNVPFRVRQ